MEDLVSGPVGLTHLLASLLGLIFGSIVLAGRKGTRQHKRWGYAYAGAMVVVNGSAFLLYNLFGGFGVFHIAALISFLTLIGGMVPVLRRTPGKHWGRSHFTWMYWSVIGLYAAFVSEAFTRLPESPFFTMVSVATFFVIATGLAAFMRLAPRWQKAFATWRNF